jgi:SMC interacting uncharacterized protein involved in chromosome segregation
MDNIERQIEKLAIAVANGFNAIEERFEAVDKRFDEMSTRFDNLEHKVSGLREDVFDVRLAIQELREISISLDEQAELRARMVRIEDHLGLPHELPPKPAM